jgi:hypothetical protein
LGFIWLHYERTRSGRQGWTLTLDVFARLLGVLLLRPPQLDGKAGVAVIATGGRRRVSGASAAGTNVDAEIEGSNGGRRQKVRFLAVLGLRQRWCNVFLIWIGISG